MTTSRGWVRVNTGFYGLPTVALAGDIAEIGSRDPMKLGFRKFPSRPGGQPIPRSKKLMLDLSSRKDADFYRVAEEPGDLLFGAAFVDRSPDEWWEPIHARGSAIVVLAPYDEMMSDLPDSTAQFLKRLSRMWIAEIPLMLRAWPDGVGSRPAETAL